MPEDKHPNNVNSRIFGQSRRASIHELSLIEALVTECPVDVFQSLNKQLNESGLCISMATVEEKNGASSKHPAV